MPSRSSERAEVAITEAAHRVRALIDARAARRVVVDGRSGAGKTTLARLVVEAWPGAQLVSLDELYPGWGGLREGAALACALVLAPHAAGSVGRYRRFDWALGTFAGAEVRVDPDRPLVVEGCGALTPASAEVADASVWLDAEAALRRERALARDGDGFAPYWDMWAAQEDAHIASEAPEARADLALLTR
ncbi:hypothetical protein [Microbacterium sp. JZ101]